MLSRIDIFFALHAIQTGCITLDTLTRAIVANADLPKRTLYDILVNDKWIDPEMAQLLLQLVERRYASQGSDGFFSDSSALPEFLSQLRQLNIPELNESLATVFHLENSGSDYLNETAPHTPQLTQGILADQKPRKGSSRFRVIRLHAKGGLGEVFVARDEELGREVALKEIQGRFAFHAESRNRFLLEAEVTSSLEHPGIVPVYGMGQYSDGRPYYAMRFVRGDSLKEAIERFHQKKPIDFKSLEFRNLLGRFIDVCQAIGYAHSRGVLHRDLKPGNVMLGEHGETMVVDWGLARCSQENSSTDAPNRSRPLSADLSSTPTLVGTVIGTPSFMPPEQARGELDKLSPASDVYSLGATLYQLLTNKQPFAGLEMNSVLTAVIEGQFPAPRSIVRSVPKSLEAICLKAMAQAPEERFQKPQELAEEIDRYLADEAVSSYVEPLDIRISRWIRKHPAQVAAAVATIVLGLIGSVLIAYVNGKHARDLESINANLTIARNDAEREQLQAEGVTDFLVQSFRKIDPDQDGKDVKLLEVLERARKKLEEQVEMEPTQKADLLQALGLSYLELGSNMEAIALFEKCLSIRTEHLGENHRETLSTVGSLGLAHLSAGQFETAMEFLSDAEKRMTIHVGLNHEDTMNALINLANGYSEMGLHDKAIEKFGQAYERMKTWLGETHPSTIATMGRLGFAYETIGDFERGVPLLEKTLELTKTKLGENHTETLTCMNNLALSYCEMGEIKRAIPLYEEALSRVREKFGEDHWETYSSMSNLADAYSMNGQHDLSIPLALKATDWHKAKLGVDHPSTLTSMGMLAAAYFSANQLDMAEPLFAATLQARRAKLGASHPSTITSMNNLGRLYQSQGKFEESLKIFKELVPLATENLGPEHMLTLTSMNNLAVALRETKNYTEAIPLFKKTLELMKTTLGEGHLSAFTCTHNLAATYLNAGMQDEAIEAEDHAFNGMRNLLGNEHATVQKVGQSYASILLGDGKFEKGVAVLKVCIDAQRDLSIKNDLELAELLDNSSILLLKANQHETAERYSEESVAIRTIAQPTDWRTYRSMTILGNCLVRQKKYSKAEPLLLEALGGFESTQLESSEGIRESTISGLKAIVELYTATEEREKGIVWQEKLDTFQTKQ